MSAGALGGGAFSYLNPIDIVVDNFSLSQTKPEVEASSDVWHLVLDLSGMYYIRRLTLTSDNYLESTIRIERDGKTEEFTEKQGGANSSETLTVVGEATSSYTTRRYYNELIVKDSLKVWLNVSKCSGDNTYTARTASVGYNYCPVVVETLV
ncbi:hypothetical protein QRC94_003765 [Vibrio vulnificus]|nr:hypothetical protein [Vibrio vulnificus]ELR8547945.1 hypothetical protein [Vibrio vulnificus]ELR8552699.1 hypothetical protein [Vibrio vulnificus]